MYMFAIKDQQVYERVLYKIGPIWVNNQKAESIGVELPQWRYTI